ncbi:hypothetical protein FA95DRAFT_1614084 [Auriscalpium vulgare]|uniref:Uncharacterized protein n=1 Tax=Auriscalpium vulgare TaxID=40419 RepID=A0ACB8R1S5_9AGAM|nr:hypothetical protein FA95DRAFT_1614084 [Auriscalpium vulgare]
MGILSPLIGALPAVVPEVPLSESSSSLTVTDGSGDTTMGAGPTPSHARSAHPPSRTPDTESDWATRRQFIKEWLTRVRAQGGAAAGVCAARCRTHRCGDRRTGCEDDARIERMLHPAEPVRSGAPWFLQPADPEPSINMNAPYAWHAALEARRPSARHVPNDAKARVADRAEDGDLGPEGGENKPGDKHKGFDVY